MRKFISVFAIVAIAFIGILEFQRLNGGSLNISSFFTGDPPIESKYMAGQSCFDLHQEFFALRTPEGTYKKELEMKLQGIYCHDLPIFDPAWRLKGSAVIADRKYAEEARGLTSGYKSEKAGMYAVIYYPARREIGPVFLREEGGRWVIDRTAVERYIHYDLSNTVWYASDGSYEYLALLQKVLPMRHIERLDGTRGYQVTSN